MKKTEGEREKEKKRAPTEKKTQTSQVDTDLKNENK